MTPATAAVRPRPSGSRRAAGRGSTAVGVLGASGYAGSELVRLLAGHPGTRLVAAGSRQFAGQRLSRVLPFMPDASLVLDEDPVTPGAWLDRGVEVVFSALPHGAFAARARGLLEAGIRVIDLSSDFRLRSPAEHLRRYGREHADPRLLDAAVYGLTEWHAPEVTEALLVANPGCYATAILLGLLPAARAGWLSRAPILVNAISGLSGAGRSASLTTHFVECEGSVAPYRVGEEHQHLGEIHQTLDATAGGAGPVILNPHIAPMSRGILASIVAPLARPVEPAEARDIYLTAYAKAPFMRVLEDGLLPETRHVRGSNRCDLAVRVAAGGDLLMVFSAIDNLVKGAAGQAIQNFNLMTGWPEPTGLPVSAWGCA